MRVDEIRVQIAARPTSTYTTRDAALIGPKIAATRSKSNHPTNNQLSPPITRSTSANQYEPFIGNSSLPSTGERQCGGHRGLSGTGTTANRGRRRGSRLCDPADVRTLPKCALYGRLRAPNPEVRP